ncbi:MAG TPA: glycosyltransferase N-terminal domain-containing protein [Candidatus Acidoferrales bacterium]|nr:glycosyltransferase N-terminal domain-containing protein [Candidatus Acidoferrales bacterium]
MFDRVMPGGEQDLTGRLTYALYDVLGAVVTLLGGLLLPVLYFTQARRGLSERLGRLPASATQLRRPLWLHAASVGEVLAAQPLVRLIRQERPDVPIIVSTTSLTGRETARTQLTADAVMLLPADIRWVVGGVLRRLRPRCLVIVETELWPALLRAASLDGIPIAIVSGRVSERAASGYARFKGLMKAMLQYVDGFAMQSSDSARRLLALGAPPEKVHVVGNLKFARGMPTGTSPATSLLDLGGRPVLIAGSTHPGEETLVLDACESLWKLHATVLLVVAPRRPERFDVVAQELAQRGLRYQRRSELSAQPAADTQVLLLDTLGELLDIFPQASAVFVGGTVAPVGGHNVLEPAIFGKPASFGPQTANVAAAAELLVEAGAAVRIHNSEELQRAWRSALENPAAAAAMGERGRAAIEAHADVAQRTLAMIRPYLDVTE